MPVELPEGAQQVLGSHLIDGVHAVEREDHRHEDDEWRRTALLKERLVTLKQVLTDATSIELT